MHTTQRLFLSLVAVFAVPGAGDHCQAATIQLVIPNPGFEEQGAVLTGTVMASRWPMIPQTTPRPECQAGFATVIRFTRILVFSILRVPGLWIYDHHRAQWKSRAACG